MFRVPALLSSPTTCYNYWLPTFRETFCAFFRGGACMGRAMRTGARSQLICRQFRVIARGMNT